MIHKDTFRKIDFNGSKGLVFIDDKILVYRRDDKTNNSPMCIDLPGGGRENNETPFECFRREVREEFGIEIQQCEIEFSCTVNSAIEPGKKSFFIVAKTRRYGMDDIVFGNEGLEWMMMTPEEFIKRPDGIERQQKRVERYLAGNMKSE